MPRDSEDIRKPRGKCIQIKGTDTDPLILRVEAYQKRVGLLNASTAVRILLKQALDHEERKANR
jgi:hypothetical protein